MKVYKLAVAICAVLILVSSCKKDKLVCVDDPVKTVYETEIYEFQLVDKGEQSKGFCGPIIRAYLDSTKNTMIYFKGIDLPRGIDFDLNRFYKGRFRVLPEKYTCMDGVGDPLPNQPSPTIYPNFVVILNWELK